ncbi:MAG: hypothetical protein IPK08_19650 [Bacteroidetes bacterium]|nr:hypothetical protein [Bacteroidota bacterium]
MTEIRLIEVRQKKYFPKVVFTAWYDKLKESLSERVMVFDKKKVSVDEVEMSKMFNYLKVNSQNSTEFQIRNQYSDIFRITKSTSQSYEFDNNWMGILDNFVNSKADKESFNQLRDVLGAYMCRFCKRQMFNYGH